MPYGVAYCEPADVNMSAVEASVCMTQNEKRCCIFNKINRTLNHLLILLSKKAYMN